MGKNYRHRNTKWCYLKQPIEMIASGEVVLDEEHRPTAWTDHNFDLNVHNYMSEKPIGTKYKIYIEEQK